MVWGSDRTNADPSLGPDFGTDSYEFDMPASPSGDSFQGARWSCVVLRYLHQSTLTEPPGSNAISKKRFFYHEQMSIEELHSSDRPIATVLWREVGLTRPWNDAAFDFDRALQGETSTVLGARLDGELVGTVMVGHDGHRGWVYYLAVAPSCRGIGLGSQLMSAAEDWLRAKGAVKIQLMVRHSNEEVVAFYEHLGYEDAEVTVLSRWLVPHQDA